MNDWKEIKYLKCENIDRKVLVKYKNGRTSLRLVSRIFQFPWNMEHNAESFRPADVVITHYKEL